MTAIPHLPAKTRLEAALVRFQTKMSELGSGPTESQLRHIAVERAHIRSLAEITRRLQEYQGWVEKASYEELLRQPHDSARLGANMRAAGRPKPTDRHDPHAIVAGNHAAAALSRITLAQHCVGIDEHENGAWLPRRGNDAKASKNWATPGAVPHSRIHRKTYFEWIEDQLLSTANGEDVRRRLLLIGRRLEHGALPPEILEGIKHDRLQNS